MEAEPCVCRKKESPIRVEELSLIRPGPGVSASQARTCLCNHRAKP